MADTMSILLAALLKHEVYQKDTIWYWPLMAKWPLNK